MKVKFLPQNVEFEIDPLRSVMNLAHEQGMFIKSICKGIPSCAECRVRIVEGESNVLPPGQSELALIGSAYFVDQRRLSCQLRCFGDVTVDLSEQEEKRLSQGKHPRGRGPRDAAESFAVRGNMIDQSSAEPLSEPSQELSAPLQPEQPRAAAERPPQSRAVAERPPQSRAVAERPPARAGSGRVDSSKKTKAIELQKPAPEEGSPAGPRRRRRRRHRRGPQKT